MVSCSDGSIFIHDTANLGGNPKTRSRVVSSSVKGSRRNGRHAHRKSVEAVQWYPNDHAIFTSSGMDGKLKVGNFILEMQIQGKSNFPPSRQVWDTNSMKPADSYNFHCVVYCHHMSAHAKHQLIAVASSINHVRLVDVKSGSNTHELRGHAGSVICCKWANGSENLLATGGADGKILLWDVRRGKSFLKLLDSRCVLNLDNFCAQT